MIALKDKVILMDLDREKLKRLLSIGDLSAAFDAIKEVFHPLTFATLNNKLYFSATEDQGIYGRELWISDGTQGSARMFKDIYPGVASSYPESLTRRGDTVYFSANDGEHGHELWRTDGTTNGTSMVFDINPGKESSRLLIQ